MIDIVDIGRLARAFDTLVPTLSNDGLRASAAASTLTTLDDAGAVLRRTRSALTAGADPTTATAYSHLDAATAAINTARSQIADSIPAQQSRFANIPIVGQTFNRALVPNTGPAAEALTAAAASIRSAQQIVTASPAVRDAAAGAREVAEQSALGAGRLDSAARAGATHVPLTPEIQRVVDQSGNASQAFARAIVRRVVAPVLGLRVLGAENLPHTGGYLLAPTHGSNLDPLIAAASAGRSLRFMAACSVLKTPLLGPLVERTGAFGVNRGSGQAREAIAISHAIVSHGDPVVIFPEGRRVLADHSGELHTGLARVALASGVPVVPAASYALKPSWTRPLQARGKYMIFGEPMSFPGMEPTAKNIRSVTELIAQRTDALHEQARAAYTAQARG